MWSGIVPERFTPARIRAGLSHGIGVRTALHLGRSPVYACRKDQKRGREVKALAQRRMHCPCGRAKIIARGLCGVCYTLRQHDRRYFGGLREAVLARDGYSCRVCGAPGRRKRSILVHHRAPGKSILGLMIALCPGCHAKVHRTRNVLRAMPPLLLQLWREQHPRGHEQTRLDFRPPQGAMERVPLFGGEGK